MSKAAVDIHAINFFFFQLQLAFNAIPVSGDIDLFLCGV